MEISFTINEKWRFCIFACFVGSIILLYYLNHDQERVNLSASGNIAISTISSNDSEQHSAADMAFAASRNIAITMSSSDDSNQHPAADMQFLQPSNITENGTNVNGKEDSCNIFDGKWVYDPTTSPLYHGSQCPFLSEQVSCQRNGRPDFEYENWSWEAKRCQIPRFSGTNMLEKLKGKRLIIVGDSINRNQFESLDCLLYSAIPSSQADVDTKGRSKFFRAKEYNCSVEFYWSPFLVKLKRKQELGGRILMLDKLSDWERNCRGANIMLFNSAHWWLQGGSFKRWDLFLHKGKVVEEMEIQSAFGKAMKTWSRWIDRNVDKTTTKVFFRSFSPAHLGKEWCYNQTQPIKDESLIAKVPSPMEEVIEKTIGLMRTPVRYLNITKLTQYRKDAHTSVYTIRQGKLLTAVQRRQPESYADCSHWCLPGVPDTWNRLCMHLWSWTFSNDNLLLNIWLFGLQKQKFRMLPKLRLEVWFIF